MKLYIFVGIFLFIFLFLTFILIKSIKIVWKVKASRELSRGEKIIFYFLKPYFFGKNYKILSEKDGDRQVVSAQSLIPNQHSIGRGFIFPEKKKGGA